MIKTGNISAWLTVLRWGNSLTAGFSFLLGWVIAVENPFIDLVIFWIALGVVILATAGGNLINDWFDQTTDAVNRPEKRKIGVSIGSGVSLLVYLLLVAVSLLSAFFFLPLPAATLVLVNSLLLFFYSLVLKRLPLIGNGTVSYLLGSVFLLPWLMTGQGMENAFWLMVVVFFFSMPREIVKDLEDLSGDRAAGFKTLPVVFGEDWVRKLAFFLIMIALLSAIIPVILEVWGLVFLFLYLAFSAPVLLFLSFKTLKAKTTEDYHLISSGLKLVIIPCFIALIADRWSMVSGLLF